MFLSVKWIVCIMRGKFIMVVVRVVLVYLKVRIRLKFFLRNWFNGVCCLKVMSNRYLVMMGGRISGRCMIMFKILCF